MANTVKKIRKSTAPYYGAAAVWVVWALVFRLYRLSDFLLAAGLSLGAFLLLRAVCQDEEIEVEVPEPPPEPTGNPELDKMAAGGQKALAEMRRLDEAIADEKISAAIRRMETLCQQIFAQVQRDPSRLPQTHRFMDYFLPTTLKLLNAYSRMDGISGENTSGAKQRIENIMDTVVTAFEKQLDSLFSADAMDVSTDITVLEAMLEREGLTADPTDNTGGPDTGLKL